MALRTQINAAVNAAFAAVQDLAVEATLTQAAPAGTGGYNFATGEINAPATPTTTIRAIFLSENDRSRDGNRNTYRVIVRAADVPEIDVYDSLEVTAMQSAAWQGSYRIERFTSNSFTHTLEVSGA